MPNFSPAPSAPKLPDTCGIWQDSTEVVSCGTAHELAADSQVVQQGVSGFSAAPGQMWHNYVTVWSTQILKA